MCIGLLFLSVIFLRLQPKCHRNSKDYHNRDDFCAKQVLDDGGDQGQLAFSFFFLILILNPATYMFISTGM